MAETLPKGTRVMTLTHSGWNNLFGEVATPELHYQYGVRFTHIRTMHYFTARMLAEVPLPMTRERWDAMTEQEQRQYVERRRIQIRHSSGICEEETAGWGEFDADHGYFEFPCWWAIKERTATHAEG